MGKISPTNKFINKKKENKNIFQATTAINQVDSIDRYLGTIFSKQLRPSNSIANRHFCWTLSERPLLPFAASSAGFFLSSSLTDSFLPDHPPPGTTLPSPPPELKRELSHCALEKAMIESRRAIDGIEDEKRTESGRLGLAINLCCGRE